MREIQYLKREVVLRSLSVIRNRIAFRPIMRTIYQPVTFRNSLRNWFILKILTHATHFTAQLHSALLLNSGALSGLSLLIVISEREVYALPFPPFENTVICPLLGVFKSSLNTNLHHVFIPTSWNLVCANIKGCHEPPLFCKLLK